MLTSQTLKGWSSKVANIAAGTIIVIGGGSAHGMESLREQLMGIDFTDVSQVIIVADTKPDPSPFSEPFALWDEALAKLKFPDISFLCRMLKGACLANVVDNQYTSESPQIKYIASVVTDVSSDFKMSTSI